MTAPWDCSTCGAPGVKNLGVRGHCPVHLADVLALLSPDVFCMNGIMLQSGITRPEFGPGFAECCCCACEATAVAYVGSSCAYCERTRERLVEWQAALTLTPPDTHPHDRHYKASMQAWAERLARAADAGLVTEDDAQRAWRKAVGYVNAA